jgi:adenosylhomocysteine nucleosidase
MIGITFAVRSESSDLRRRLREIKRHDDLIFGKIGNHSVAIAHTGVGAKDCNQRLELLIHKARPKFLISSGFAGAVTKELHSGDLILAENFSDSQLLSRAAEILREQKPRSVKLFTATSIIDSIDRRNQIARESGAAAVDMETGAIAAVCNAHGVPLLSLRVISDSPTEPFPAPMSILFDMERQKADLRKLFAYIVAGPTRLIRLLHFFQQIRHARKVLAEALVSLVSQV